MKRFGILSIALAMGFTIACNGNARTDTGTSNDTTVGTSGTEHRISASDRNWIQDMLADGNAEIELGKLASQQASSPDVKRFAQMMVADHTKAGNELKKIADTYAVQPDTAKLDDKHHDVMDKLSKLHGADFDREYINAMVDDHQDAVGDLEKRVDVVPPGNGVGDKVKGTFGSGKAEAERNGAVQPEKADDHLEASVNSWAAQTLPTVRHHLDEAKQIQDKLQNTRSNTTAQNIAPKRNGAHKGLGKSKP
jgi:putative membrane protein